MELISKRRLCSFQLYNKATQLTIYITLLTISLFIFFSISTVHVSFGISFVSLTFPRSFYYLFLILSNTMGCIAGSSEFLIFFLVNKLPFFVRYALSLSVLTFVLKSLFLLFKV